jgi:hypothetical protein
MEDPRIEYTIQHEKRKMVQSSLSTDAKKNKYVHDIKNGLGELIIEEPNKPQKKVRWYHKLFRMLQ